MNVKGIIAAIAIATLATSVQAQTMCVYSIFWVLRAILIR